jgi:hypothetical protein
MYPYYDYRFNTTQPVNYGMTPYGQNVQYPYGGNVQYPYGLDEDTEIYFGKEETGEERQPPQPIVTNPTPTTSIILRKELTGYPNYGNPSRNADILYTGTEATYTFNIPPFLFIPGQLNAFLIFRGVLDDHYNVSENLYTASINVNGREAFSGRVPFVHGRPAGTVFENWNNLRVNVTNFRRNNTIRIRNTSRAGSSDWIGLDWIEMRLTPR